MSNEHKRLILDLINKRQKRYKLRHPFKTVIESMMQFLMTATLKFSWTQKFINWIGKRSNPILGIPARRFIAGDTIGHALRNRSLKTLTRKTGAKPIFAYEVESTFNPKTAEENFKLFKHCVTAISGLPSRNMSIKLSSLAFFKKDPEHHGYSEPQIDKIIGYLHQLLHHALRGDVLICIDMESYIYKDPTLKIFTKLLNANPTYANHLQLAFQCYLKDSPQDAQKLVAWAKQFNAQTGKKVRLRVVKGANIVTDQRHAQMGLIQQNPIADTKEITQRQFIDIMKFFEDNTDCLIPVYGTMNPDTIAHIVTTQQMNGQDPAQRQIQTLFGMNDPLRYALAGSVEQQVYVPYAPLPKILAYMIRRFNELSDSQKGKMPIMEYHDEKLVQIN